MNAFLIAAAAAVQADAPPAPAPAGEVVPAATPVAAPLSPPAAMTPAAPCCTLAKLTAVYLTLDEPVESDKAKIGQRFGITLSQPITVADGLVIPAGTKGVGEAVHAAKSRAMGKAGELLLAARYLDWNGTRIPLRSFKFGAPQGRDNATTAAIVGVAVSAWITPFITGGEVRIPAGTETWAKVAADVALAPAAAPAAASTAVLAAAGQSPTETNEPTGGEK